MYSVLAAPPACPEGEVAPPAEVNVSRMGHIRQIAADASRDFLTYLVFCKGYLPARHHEIIAERLLHGDRLELILGPPSSGKCLDRQEHLTLADGRRMPVEKLVGQEFEALTLTEGGIVPVRARAEWAEMEPVFELVGDSGQRVVRNAAHPFWAASTVRERGRMKRTWVGTGVARPALAVGWRPLAALSPGDLVAVPTTLPAFGSESMPEWEIKLLAYFIGDGAMTSGLRFTQLPGRVLDEFKDCAEQMGCEIRLVPNTSIEYYIIRAGHGRARSRAGAFLVDVLKGGPQAAKEIERLARVAGISAATLGKAKRDLGIWSEKRGFGGPRYWHLRDGQLPLMGAERFQGDRTGQDLNKNPVCTLLRTHQLFGKHSRDKRVPEAVFSLPASELAIFLNRLFATDGWAAMVRRGARKGPEIGYCSASEGLVRDVQELLLRFGIHGRVRDRAPVKAWVFEIHRVEDVVAFCERIGIFGKETAVGAVYDHASTRPRSHSKWRATGLPEGLRWERIKRISPLGIRQTVAVEVPEHRTFLTTFFEHNTSIGISFAEWVLGRNPNYRWLIASEVSSGIATTITSEIASTLEFSEPYRLTFGELKDPTGRTSWSNQTMTIRPYISPQDAKRLRQPPSPPPPFPWLPPRGRNQRITGKHPSVKAVGWRVGYAGSRCEGILADDLVSDQISRSEKLTQQVFDTLHQKLLARPVNPAVPREHPEWASQPEYRQHVVVFGQRWAPRDLFGMLIEGHGGGGGACVVYDSNPDRDGLWVLDPESDRPEAAA